MTSTRISHADIIALGRASLGGDVVLIDPVEWSTVTGAPVAIIRSTKREAWLLRDVFGVVTMDFVGDDDDPTLTMPGFFVHYDLARSFADALLAGGAR